MEDSRALNRLAPAPRNVSPRLAAQMLLGGAGAQIGWLLFGFGSIFFWAFAWRADLSSWRFQPGSFAETTGRALGCKDTHYAVGGSDHRRGTPVYENRYRYDAGGRTFETSSYATGKCVGGGAVTVQYIVALPQFSRIAGMRHDLLSPWAALAALLPAVGLGIAIRYMAQGRGRVRLLRDGLPATGRLVERVDTGTRISGRPLYRMSFEYTAQDGSTGRATARTNRPERLEDDTGEWLLYDPANLAGAVMFDNVPGVVTIDGEGQPQAGRSMAFLFLPVVALLGNGWWMIHHWSR